MAVERVVYTLLQAALSIPLGREGRQMSDHPICLHRLWQMTKRMSHREAAASVSCPASATQAADSIATLPVLVRIITLKDTFGDMPTLLDHELVERI